MKGIYKGKQENKKPFWKEENLYRLENGMIEKQNNLASLENYISFPGFAGTFGMIQQERQNNIINILGGHSYAM